MIANVNLNTVAGKRDTFHVFILFRLNTFAGSTANFEMVYLGTTMAAGMNANLLHKQAIILSLAELNKSKAE